jgi:uncharacterized protein YciI
MNTLPPIRRAILVEADPAAAFEVFTAGLGRWWPLGEHSVHGVRGQAATASFEKMSVGARIVERTLGSDPAGPDGASPGGAGQDRTGGEVTVWGTVTRWDPPKAVVFSWHPGYSADRASQVKVTFAAADPAPDGTARTLVRLEHTGWEAFAEPAAARAEYDEGWPFVLGRYAEHVAGASAGQHSADEDSGGQHNAGQHSADEDRDADTWVALMHRPGPQAPRGGALAEDPRFGEHVAFLNRMRAAGYLVLAGPLADADGEGMTVLRLPGPGMLGTATRLAEEDDVSVASGFLSVTVRPWLVVMRGA